jgi:predicted ATPase
MNSKLRLDFERISLHGRDDEVVCLEESFHRVKQDGVKKVIFIRGDPGSGKTTLVETVLRKYTHTNDVLIVRGKFDAVSNQPMSTIQDILNHFFRQVTAINQTEEESEMETLLTIHIIDNK